MVMDRLPTDRGWAWVIVIGSFFNFFIMVGIAKSLGILMSEFIVTFDVSTALTAMVMSVAGIVYAFFAPICIILGEHFTARRVVMIGGLVAMIGISISSLLFNMSFVIGFMGIGFGIGNSCIFGNSLVMIGTYFRKRRTLANGIALAGASIGQFTIPPLMQYLLDAYSLSGTLLILSAIYFNVTVCGAVFRPIPIYPSKTRENGVHDNSVKENKIISDGETTNQASDQLLHDPPTEVCSDFKLRSLMASTGSIYLEEDVEIEMAMADKNNETSATAKKSLCSKLFDFSVLRRPISIFYVIIAFLAFFGYFNFIIFLPLHVTSKGVTKYNKALLLSICGIGDLFGRLGSGFIGDLNLIARYKIKAVAVIMVGISILMFVFADSFIFMTVLAGFYGFAGGIYVNYVSIVLIDFVGLKMMPKVLALVLFFQGSGAASGQPFLGWLRDVTGSFECVLYICGTTPIIAGILLFCYPLVKKWDKRTELQ